MSKPGGSPHWGRSFVPLDNAVELVVSKYAQLNYFSKKKQN
ncbi:hypothetical protein [cyanobacterium endosymbiont of Rhopalodia gibberula]|nr:hypothetical protein [cyanobacterium endosymbiont of Rhopalodia gibberula]